MSDLFGDEFDIAGGSNSEIEAEAIIDEGGKINKAYITVMENCTINFGMYSDKISYKEGQIIPVQFNPTSYTINTSTRFKKKHGGVTQNSKTFCDFSIPSRRSLSVKLLYDSVVQTDYLDKVNGTNQFFGGSSKSMSLKAISNKDNSTKVYKVYSKYSDETDLSKTYIRLITGLVSLSNLGRPPLISFTYGNMIFIGHANNIDVECTRFNSDGDVIRAEIDLVIKEVYYDEGKKSI